MNAAPQGFKLSIKNGTFFLNDNVTIEFEEATVTLPGMETVKITNKVSESNKQPVKTLFVQEGEKQVKETDIKPSGKKSIKKKIATKIKTISTSSVIDDQPSAFPVINELFAIIKEKGPISKAEIINMGYNAKAVTNFLHTYKKRCKIISTAPSIYDMPGRIPPPIKGEESPYKDADGIEIKKGDKVQLLNSNAVRADDVIDFEDTHSYSFGIVAGWDDGSSMIRFKTGDYILLVYPHWVKKVS